MPLINPQMIHVLMLGAIAGLATTVGAALVTYIGKPKENILALLLAGAGGVMLAVVAIDLLPTAWAYGPPAQFWGGVATGVLLMRLAVSSLEQKKEAGYSRRQRLKNTGILIALGIALHDIPEGMAISVGHEAASQLGALLAMAIAIHNLPEGMATAAPLKMAGIKNYKIMLLNLGIAVVTPLGSLLGLIALNFVSSALTFFLALAAGAMGLLVFQELLPVSRERHPNWSRLGTALGFIVFTAISLAL